MPLNDLLKKLLPGFLPLFVFIAADEIWGTKTGLIVAISFGFIELILGFIKTKKIDYFVLVDTGFIVFLGGISLLLENELFFKLKPAVISTILCSVVGMSAFSKRNLVLLMSTRYFQNIPMTSEMENQFTKSLKIMFWIFSVHTLLTIYSAFFMSKEAWAFISGGLFYILFGLVFIWEILKKRRKGSVVQNEEWLPVVTPEGKIIGKATRSECHKSKNLLHPVVHLHLINSSRQIYLQKRPMNKLIQPGKWDTAVGGHVSFEETIEQALQKEALEELNIKDFKSQLLMRYIWESEVERELVYLFITNSKILPEINKDELEDGKFWGIIEIEKNIPNKIFTPNFLHEFQFLKKIILKNSL